MLARIASLLVCLIVFAVVCIVGRDVFGGDFSARLQKRSYRILLLGTEESGKTTFAKQLAFIYNGLAVSAAFRITAFVSHSLSAQSLEETRKAHVADLRFNTAQLMIILIKNATNLDTLSGRDFRFLVLCLINSSLQRKSLRASRRWQSRATL